MAAKKNQLSVLIPDRSFDTSIGDLVLKPFKFKQFNTALEIIQKYVQFILGGEDKSNSEEDKAVLTTASIINFLLEKTESDYSVLIDIVKLLSLVSGKESEEIDELTYDEVFALLSEVIDQNMDFFSRIGKKINPGPAAEPNGETPEVTTGESESLG
jgi:type I site-specific restriction-modification system R (restriction) subunit